MSAEVGHAVLAKLFAERDGALFEPKYRRIAADLRAAIRSGNMAAGSALPPERDLAERLGVSRVTVRRAVAVLVQQGLLQARQGSGTFVAMRMEQTLSRLGSFSEDMARRGLTPGSRWLNREIAPPTPAESLALGLGSADRVLRIARVRTADGAPMAVERAAIDARFLGGRTDFGPSLYEALRAAGIQPVRAFQRLRAGLAGAEDAALLALEPGDPVLQTERRSFSKSGLPVELTTAVYRGDRYDYVIELNATADFGRQEEMA